MQQLEKGALPLRPTLERIKSQLASPAFIEGLRDQEFWFENLVENGTFDADASGWVLTGDGSIGQASGELVVTFGTTITAANQNIPVTAGKTYVVTWAARETTTTNGLMRLTVATNAAIHINSTVNKDFEYTFTAASTTLGVACRLDSAGSVNFDNVSVFETDGTNIIHRMPTGWKPRRVFVDGLLLREGATHDYEIKQDPEGYYIVPAVAPGANTETCILGVRA